MDDNELIDSIYNSSPEVQARIKQEQDNARYKASLMTSLPISPEQATKQYQLSKQTGIPVGIVRAKENEIAQRTELATFEDSDFVNNFPKVVAQLSRPEVAGAIKDDIDSLSTFERISRSTQEKFQQSALQDETVDLRLRRMGFEATGNEKYKLRPSEEALISEFDRAQPKDYELGFVSSIIPETGSGLRTVFGVAKRAGLKAIAATGLGAAIGGTAAALTTKTAPAGAIAGARVGLTYGGGAASGYEMAKLEAAGAYDELRNVVDETGKPLEKDVAAGAALATGAINGAIELIPAKIGLDTIKKAFSREGTKQLVKNPVAREYLKNIGKGLLAEGATEGTQEFFNIVLGEAAKAVSSGDFKVVGMKDANDTEGLLKFLSDSSQRIGTSAAAGAAGGAGFGVIGGGAITAKKIYDNKKANEREQEAITQIIDTSKQSKVLQRDSTLFKDVTENTLGETNIYIPAEQIQTYFQEKPDQAASFFRNIPDAQEQIQEALDTGGNLVIKGNDLVAAVRENPELETLKEFMKLSPESFTSLEAQDEFLTRVVPEQVAMEEEAISNAERDAIKKNIRQQISGVIPTKEQEDYIKLLESYYDTRAKKYGSEAAKKILETYLGQLEIGQKKFQKPSPFKMVEDLDLMIDKARKPIKQPKATKPLLKTLKEMGGVRIGSNLAGELNAMGVTSRTAPALFRKENGLGDIDNIPLSEFQTKFPNVQAVADETGNYVDRNYLLNLLSEEQFGKDITQVKTPEQEQIDNFLQGLEEAGIDLNASNEEIKKAIKEYQGRTFNQAQDQTKRDFVEDEHGRNIVYDKNGFQISVNDPNDATFIVLWKDGKRIGQLNTTNKARPKEYQRFIDIGKVEIDKKFRGLGLSTEMYKALLKYSSDKFDGIVSYLSDRSNKKQVPAIYRRLGGKTEGDYAIIEKPQTFFQTSQDQTKTPAFKKWFGDSKVVDEKGEPLVVYHGTNDDFAIFDRNFSKNGSSKFGFWATSSKEQAAIFGDKQKAIYAKIKNPKIFSMNEWNDIRDDHRGDNKWFENWRETLKSEGYDGLIVESENEPNVYAVFESNQFKSVENKGTFDPENPNIYKQDVKGQTQFIGQKPVITLFEKADRSTLLHELGHTFLQIEADVAKLPDMPADFKEDWATLEKWLGVKDGIITREAHEKFARGFEAYVREGKAPSLELRSAFRRFKAWLVKVYQDVLNLNVKLNDDIRGYFDRLLATDEAIETQRNNPIFATDKNVLELLTKKEREDYTKISDNAKEKTKEQLLKKAFKQSELKNKKSYKEALEEVKQEIQDELNQDKTFKVLDYLKTGKLNGEEQLKKIKLSRQDVKENYDGEFIKYLPKEIFGKDGVEVSLVADEFGFKSGSEMLYSIANAPDYKARVEELADQEMIRRYGDMLKDGTIEREALEMAENEARANKIVYELNAVNRKVRTITETKDAYKQKAKEIIEGKGIVEATDTNKYYINELKAAREAGKALGKKDYEKAVDWKKKQLLNHFLFRESKALRDEIKASKKRYDRYKKKPAKGKVVIDEDYRLRISNLLQDFGLANKGIDYVQTNIQELDAWKKGKQEEGVLGLIEFPEIADFQGKSFNQLTVEEYRTLDNAIENLAHIGRQERSIIVDGVKKSIDEFADSVQENLDKLPDKQVKIGELSKKEKYKKFFDSAVTFLDKVQTTVFKIDDKKELGVFYQGFVKGLTEGERNKDNLSRESYAKLDEIFKKHYKKGVIPSKETYFETLGQSLTKNSVIALALNWGNETNRKRIKDGYGWTDQQVNQILTTLDKNDLGFVQDIWDFINSYWPSLESIDKKIYGIAPKKEAASPITVKTNDGDVNLRGGYYPISYTEDTDFLETTAKELNSFFVNNQGSNLNVNKSYSKERATGRVQGKVDLTLNPLFQHLENVVNDIALKEPAWNAYKLIKNNKLKTQLKKKIGNADYQSLVSWVKDVYGKTSVQEGYLNKFARRARGATVMYQMGFKLSTVIIQATGLLNSTVKLGYGNMGYGIWKALGNGNPISINKAIREAEAKSKILRNRAKSFNRDVSEIMRRMERSKGIAPDVAKYAFLGITSAQKMVDVPTWYGAYYKGFKEFKDDAKAVEYADKILESTQGTSHKYALSAIERNESGFARIMTTFYSYMNVKLNLLRQSYIGTNFKNPKDVTKFVNDVTLLFIADVIATEFLRQGISEALKDGDDEEEKELSLKYANLIGQSVTSIVPGLREVYSSAIGYSAMPAGLGILDITGKKGAGVIGKEILKEDEIDWINVLRGANNTSAVFSKGGGAQIDIFLKALQDQQKGEEVAPIDFLLKSKK